LNKNAIICEGSAEEAVIEILLENSLLQIEADANLMEDGPIRVRSAQEFCERYLGKAFEGTVQVYRILDSKREKFSFKTRAAEKLYAEKIYVHNIITAPEIEVLLIISENKYDEFLKSNFKPSEFCKVVLKIKSVKNYDYIRSYFDNHEKLLAAIRVYHQKKHKTMKENERTLYDILKSEYQ